MEPEWAWDVLQKYLKSLPTHFFFLNSMCEHKTDFSNTEKNECCAIPIYHDFASHTICYLLFKMTNKQTYFYFQGAKVSPPQSTNETYTTDITSQRFPKNYTSFHASPVTIIFKKVQELVVFGLCTPSIPCSKSNRRSRLWPVLYSPLSTLLTLAKLMSQRSLSASLLSWHERPARSSLAVIAPLCVSSRKSRSRTPLALALRGNNMLPPTFPMDLRPCHL